MKRKRILKNTLMIALTVVFAGASYLTMNFIGNTTAPTAAAIAQSSQGEIGSPPDMQNNGDSSDEDLPSFNIDGNSDSDSNSRQNGNAQQGQPPHMNGQSGNFDSDSNSQQNGNAQQGQPPQMNGQNGKFDGKGKGGMPQRGVFRENSSGSTLLTIVKYGIFGFDSLAASAIVLYLIMSRFNKKGFRETFRGADRIIIYTLCVLIAASALTGVQIAASNTFFNTPQISENSGFQPIDENSDSNSNGFQPNDDSSSSVTAAGATTVTDEQTLSDSYSSKTADESAILVQEGGNATVNNATITKSGDSTNTENSEFYGVNAAVLVKENSTAAIKDANIETSAKGANAVFSTGSDSKIYISDSTITTTGESSARGLDATYGGYIEADNVTVTTKGGSCAALATDRGEGTVKVTNSKLTTNGSGSPVIYSTGDISVTDTTGTANGAQIAVVEGKNSATVTSSKLTCSAAGNRSDVDQAGVMIYQSMSGDASDGKGTFTATDSTLTVDKNSDYYKSAPMFFVTNTDAEINLTNTKLSYGSGTLLSVKGTGEWGNSGSNGGNVTLNAAKQTLKGNVEIDKISTLTMTLKNSNFEGAINTDNTAKSVSLTLDKNSKIKLTGDTYVTELNDAVSDYSNIDFNGYKLYVNGTAVN